MKTLVIIQARTGSSRLPNKVLFPLAGRPLLQRMIERVMDAASVCDIVVATTNAAADDRIVYLARGLGVAVYR